MGQSAIIKHGVDVATQPGNAGAVGIVTLITGWSAYFELLTPIVGFMAGVLGGILTLFLIVNTYQKRKEDRKLAKLKRESEHLDIEIKKKKLKEM